MFYSKLNNISTTAIGFSNYFGLKNEDELEDKILKHPFYPSLLSISEVLENEAGIKNFAVKITLAQLKDVTFPCIAHTDLRGWEYIIITDFKADTVFYELNGKRKKLALSEFEKIWTGVVLMSETQQKGLLQKWDFEKLVPYLLPTIALVLFFSLVVNTQKTSVLSLVAFIGELACLLAGLAVSVLLLIQSLGKSNALIQQLCGADAKHNCNSILSSKAATISSWLSLSDLGFLYFSGNLLLLLFSNSSSAVLILVAFNLLALPFTFWSVYYQWRIAKTWCRLCLMIQGLFWLQAIFSLSIFLPNRQVFNSFELFQIIFFLVLFTLPLFLWLSVKPLLKNLQQIPSLKHELNKFKFNVAVFQQQLAAQKTYLGVIPKTTIVLGNPDAPLRITMISNPFCNPCARAHQFLDEWLHKGMNFRLEIIYTYQMNDDDRQKWFFKHLMNIQKDGKFKIADALYHWYGTDYQKLEKWQEAFPAYTFEEDKIELLEQVNWCKLNEIKGTPTFYVNGHLLPENYRLKDLKYVLLNMGF